MKNPKTAAILNIIPGLGYTYIGGRKRIFGAILLASVAVSILALFDPLLIAQLPEPAVLRGWDAVPLTSGLLTMIAIIYDGYVSAVDANATAPVVDTPSSK